MSDPTQVELAAWLEGAVDPDRAEEIARRVASSPRLAARAAALRARLDAEAYPVVSAWSLPFPGLRMPGAPKAVPQESTVMGRLTPGARFEVRIEDPPDPEAVRLVVLTRADPDWVVVFPIELEEDGPVSALPEAKEGGRRIGLVAGPVPGVQRWALVYVDGTAPIDWAAPPEPRWRDLREALAAGQATSVVLEQVVLARR